MRKFINFVDKMNLWVGRVFAFLILFLVIAIMYEVVSRYFFNAPTRWSNEISQYLLTGVVMLGAGFCLVFDGHVRVDILHRNFSPRTKAVVDIISFLLIFMFVTAMVWKGGELCYDAFIHDKRSMTILEMPLFPSMVMVPIGGVLLGLQGMVRAIRAVYILTTGADMGPDPERGG
jgi:TRAP-type mannitol/chloroaromatic compound transport system permease small subunit